MRRNLLFCSGLAGAALACSKSEPPQAWEPPPPTVASVASALHMDASSLEIPVDPPAPAGDLLADVERFTTLDACVAERAKLDPTVGDALRAIGYETFLRDACRVLEATKQKDPAACKAIDASALRARCEATVGMFAGDADLCPWEVPSRPQYGRDAACVAVALRDARFCAAAPRSQRATCEALALRDEKRCDAGITSAERASCAREFARWRRALAAGPPGKAGDDPLVRPSGKLVLHGADGTPEPTMTEVDMRDDLARGVVLFEQRDSVRFDVGALRELGTTTFAPSPVARPYVGLTLAIPLGGGTGKDPKAGKDGKVDAKIERAELGVPGVATLITPGARAALRGTVEKLDRRRGGEVKVVIEGTIGDAPRGYDVRVEVTTYVRDVVTPGAMTRGSMAGKGDGGI